MNDRTVSDLRDAGYCVVIFTPEELRNARPNKVEDHLVEVGWEIIDCLATAEDEL